MIKFKEEKEKWKNEKTKEKQDLKKKEEEDMLKEAKKVKMNPNEIKEKIEKLLHWDNKMKEKLKIKKEEISKNKDKECTFKPKIKKLKNENISSLTERLYNKDIEKRKVKKEYLDDIYCPTFAPTTNKHQPSYLQKNIKGNFNKTGDISQEENRCITEISQPLKSNREFNNENTSKF